MEGTLAVIGAGRLGEALLHGLLRSGTVTASQIVGTVANVEHAGRLAERHGIRAGTDNAAAVAAADVVVLGVKPQVLPAVLSEIAAALRPDTLVVSLAAGITTSHIEAALPTRTPVVRVMTNTPVQVDTAMSVIAGGRSATDGHLELATSLLTPVGAVRRLDERHFDAVTAVSGSGPAYVFLLAEAMVDAGVGLGLPPDDATVLVTQTLLGAATLLAASDQTPAALREAVTSPGGTTAAAIATLDARGVGAAIAEAIGAAATRSRELGD